jgi:glutamate/tyrosine decarboxylase-like PLP-dependent enzyme
MTDLRDLFVHTAELAAAYRLAAADAPVAPVTDRATLLAGFGGDLPSRGVAAAEVVDELVAAAAPGLIATTGPRYFGFVIGGSLPAAAAADMLTTAWDQPAYNEVTAPAAGAVERVAGRWLKQLLRVPASATAGFVTGAQAANNVGLAAARHRVLADAGWDVERDGLIGAPRVRIVATEERHATVDRALRLLGFGTAVLEPVDTDRNGAIDVEQLAAVLDAGEPAPTIVCLQAGNVNTGAFDDFERAIPLAHRVGAWVHVDGAFGLWAAANPATSALVRGVQAADSWATDAHKWLNVPYDSGLAFCAHPDVHAAAMAYSAAYLQGSGSGSDFVLGDLTPESSRRARGFAVWAALRQLGSDGVADLVERCCRLARHAADRFTEGGAAVANEVVLNQVLVGFGGHAQLDEVVAAVQREGTCWIGATTWQGRRLMRFSVSNWTTTEADIDRSVAAVLAAAAAAPRR